MPDLFEILKQKGVELPENISSLLQNCRKLSVFNTTEDLAIAATNGKENVAFEVSYDIPGKGKFTEASENGSKMEFQPTIQKPTCAGAIPIPW